MGALRYRGRRSRSGNNFVDHGERWTRLKQVIVAGDTHVHVPELRRPFDAYYAGGGYDTLKKLIVDGDWGGSPKSLLGAVCAGLVVPVYAIR